MLGQLFIDLDGTISDFDQHHETVFGIRSSKLTDNVDWAKVREVKDFYLSMPPMEDFPELWDFVKSQGPVILTGVPSVNKVPEAEVNKRAWVAKHLGSHVPVICCPSSQKYIHCKPGDVLVDDWEKYKKRWLKAGGYVGHAHERARYDSAVDFHRIRKVDCSLRSGALVAQRSHNPRISVRFRSPQYVS